MRIMLPILAALSFFGGFAVFGNAKSAVHEIEGLILFLISSVFISGACTVEALLLGRKSNTNKWREGSRETQKAGRQHD